MSSQLHGKWYNELGSCMNITSEVNGTLSWTYESLVGDAEYSYTLSGRYDALPDRRSLGWTVTRTNQYHSTSKSTTCWSGQFQIQPDTLEPQILTTWLLTVQTTPEDDWNSTNVGADVFTRCPPKSEQSMRAKHQGRVSHPKEAAPAWAGQVQEVHDKLN